MMLTLYRYRLRQSVHRLFTVAIPLTYLFADLSMRFVSSANLKFGGASDIAPPIEALIFAFVLGAGAIGRDASAGQLSLLLTRPVRRSTYVLSFWAAIGTAASGWALLQLLLQLGVMWGFGAELPTALELWCHAGERVLGCFGLAATLVCLSARLPSYGNVVLFLVLMFLLDNGLPSLASLSSESHLLPLLHQLKGLLIPQLDLKQTFASTPVSWFRLTTYLSNVTLLLLLGIFLFNRREVSYASR